MSDPNGPAESRGRSLDGDGAEVDPATITTDLRKMAEQAAFANAAPLRGVPIAAIHARIEWQAADLIDAQAIKIAELELRHEETLTAAKADGLGDGWENGRLDCIACCRAEIREIEKWMARPSQDGHSILRKLRDLRPVAEAKKHEVEDA